LANQISHHFKIGAAGDVRADEVMIQQLAERIALDLERIFSMQSLIAEEIEKARVFLKSSSKG